MSGEEILAHVAKRPFQKTGGCFNLILLNNLERRKMTDAIVQVQEPLQVAHHSRTFGCTTNDSQNPREHFWRPATVARLRRIDNVVPEQHQPQNQQTVVSSKLPKPRTNEVSYQARENPQTIVKPIRTIRSPFPKRNHLR